MTTLFLAGRQLSLLGRLFEPPTRTPPARSTQTATRTELPFRAHGFRAEPAPICAHNDVSPTRRSVIPPVRHIGARVRGQSGYSGCLDRPVQLLTTRLALRER